MGAADRTQQQAIETPGHGEYPWPSLVYAGPPIHHVIEVEPERVALLLLRRA